MYQITHLTEKGTPSPLAPPYTEDKDPFALKPGLPGTHGTWVGTSGLSTTDRVMLLANTLYQRGSAAARREIVASAFAFWEAQQLPFHHHLPAEVAQIVVERATGPFSYRAVYRLDRLRFRPRTLALPLTPRDIAPPVDLCPDYGRYVADYGGQPFRAEVADPLWPDVASQEWKFVRVCEPIPVPESEATAFCIALCWGVWPRHYVHITSPEMTMARAVRVSLHDSFPKTAFVKGKTGCLR